MAEQPYPAAHETRNPTLDELGRMPDYRRELRLRYWQGDDRPSESEIAEAVAANIQDERETFGNRVVQRYVYFIQSETGPIKIGVAMDVKKRLGNLQGSSPVKLTLLLALKGGSIAECKFHHQFRDHRLHGEWFSPHPDILAEIARLSHYSSKGTV